MTGKAHENKHFFSLVSQNILHLLDLSSRLKPFHLHLQTAAVSKTEKSTSVTDVVSWIEEIYCTGISMPVEKVLGGAPLFLAGLQRIQLKGNLLLGPWLQAMCCVLKGLICICWCQSEYQVKAKAKPDKKTYVSNLPFMYLLEWYQSISTNCMLWCCEKRSASCYAVSSEKWESARISSLLLSSCKDFSCPFPICSQQTRQLWARCMGATPEAESRHCYKDPVVNICMLSFL